ncbi:MAG: acylneuraminate cytidylyltransferase family protein [Candidatus Azambacteria bacterium]|nr:acylneuraminate cytidylyltransferase family protein [Candidatus Azambacteria bacterium]
MKKIIAIIPARGGSKGIPEKNIKNFCGKPLIAWTIKEALKSKLLDRVIVSTDDKKIASVARKYGAETPFMQPEELAQSSSRMEQVFEYGIKWLKENENYNAETIVWLQPTSPLRESHHIDEAIELFFKKKCDAVISASETPASHNPYWIYEEPKIGRKTLFNAMGQNIKDIPPRRQLLPKYYFMNNIVFVMNSKNLLAKNPTLFGLKQELYTMSEFYDADINNREEWLWAENKFRRMIKQNLK